MSSGRGSSRPPLLPWSKTTWTRWASMPRMSAGVIPRTKFHLLKAPASTLYEERYGGDRNVFTVAMYAGRMMAKGVQIGCVVDCTALDLLSFDRPPDGKPVRYFHDTNEWDDFDMEYHHLDPILDDEGRLSAAAAAAASSSAAAAEVIPPPSAIQKFLSICASHWKSRPNENIALFDSRGGIGTAAFLAALYMCEKMRAPVHVALASVKEVMKPCGLADADLARELQRRYKGRREIRVDQIPDWWFAVEDDIDDDDDADDDEGGEKAEGDKAKRDRDISIIIPPFDQLARNDAKQVDASAGPARKRPRPGDGISDHPSSSSSEMATTSVAVAVAVSAALPSVRGLQSHPPGSQRYERAVSVLKQLTGRPCSDGIPIGSEIALTSSESLSLHLTHGKFKVTWQSRGRRGLLLILTEGVYFLENGGGGKGIAVSTMNMRFPHPKDPRQTQHRTLLDGSLVMDREGPAGGSVVPRYYATDILCHMGGILVSHPFGQRIKYLLDGVIMARKRDRGYDYGKEPVKIRSNEYFDFDKLGFVLRDVTKGVAHETEGVMLTPLDGKYYGTNGASGGGAALVWKRKGDISEQELLKCASSLS